MMRVSPLGIFGTNHDLEEVAEWARQDAALTHPHPVCLQANALFTTAIAFVIRTGIGAQDLYHQIVNWTEDVKVDVSLLDAVRSAATAPPADYIHQQEWVLTAVRNALWQLLHASNLEGLTERTYRLPTEAEWEYACRAGTTTPFNTGSCLSSDQANYDGNHPYKNCVKGRLRDKTTKVGSFPSNNFGLCDMHGNVREWCSDWLKGDYYNECRRKGSVVDPRGPSTGSDRVAPGGSWRSRAGQQEPLHRLSPCEDNLGTYTARNENFVQITPCSIEIQRNSTPRGHPLKGLSREKTPSHAKKQIFFRLTPQPRRQNDLTFVPCFAPAISLVVG